MTDKGHVLKIISVVALIALSGCATIGVESTVTADGMIEEYEIQIDTSRTIYGLMVGEAEDEGYESLEGDIRAEYNESHIGDVDYNETMDGDEVTIRITLHNLDPSGSDNITVRQEDGQMTYTDNTFYNESEANGTDSSDSEIELDDSFYDGFAVDYRLTMPGEITETNADEVDGNTAEWHVTGEGAFTDTKIRATSEVPATGFGPGFGVVPALVGLLIGAGLLAWRVVQ